MYNDIHIKHVIIQNNTKFLWYKHGILNMICKMNLEYFILQGKKPNTIVINRMVRQYQQNYLIEQVDCKGNGVTIVFTAQLTKDD